MGGALIGGELMGSMPLCEVSSKEDVNYGSCS